MVRVMRAQGHADHTSPHAIAREESRPMRTRLFQSGNSQAVRIPKDLAYERLDTEVEIYRAGDALVVRPVRKTLDDIGEILASFPADFMAGGRDQPDYEERNWGRLSVHED
jgi:antitoxin VapB